MIKFNHKFREYNMIGLAMTINKDGNCKIIDTIYIKIKILIILNYTYLKQY